MKGEGGKEEEEEEEEKEDQWRNWERLPSVLSI